MHFHAITEKVKVRFAKECKRSLEHLDESGTKGDKKHAKLETRS